MIGSGENKPALFKNLSAIVSLVSALFLFLLYLATLVAAFLGFPGWDHLFAACLLATIGVPILLWLCIVSLKRMRGASDDRKADGDK